MSGAIVVKIGGTALDDPAKAGELWSALGEAHRAARSQSGDPPTGVVLVHGGGLMVDRHFERLGLVSERREGIRITPREHVEEVVAVLAGRVNKAVAAAITRAGVPAAGLCLSDGGLARVRKATHFSFDPGCVGVVAGGDRAILDTLLRSGVLPVLSSIGYDEEGTPLNVNADDAAAGIAGILHAEALVFLTDVPGVLRDGVKLDRLTPNEVNALIESKVITGGMIPKVRAAASAAAASGSPVYIASWNSPRDLVRLAKREAVGTCIVPPAATPRRL